LSVEFESAFDLEIELKNVILVAFRFLRFYSQGHKTSRRDCGMFALLPTTASVGLVRQVGNVPTPAQHCAPGPAS